jgi:hypothetical protein
MKKSLITPNRSAIRTLDKRPESSFQLLLVSAVSRYLRFSWCLLSLGVYSIDLVVDISMAPPRKKARNLYKFLKTHEARFGLCVCERDSVSGAVKSVACRFCVVFGCEEKVGAKREATGRSKYLETFRTDHYIQHLTQQHSQNCSEYVKLNASQEKLFFNAVDVPFANTIEAHIEASGNIRFPINSSIVEVIIGDMDFNPADIEGVTRARALSLSSSLNLNRTTTSLMMKIILSLLGKSTSP